MAWDELTAGRHWRRDTDDELYITEAFDEDGPGVTVAERFQVRYRPGKHRDYETLPDGAFSSYEDAVAHAERVMEDPQAHLPGQHPVTATTLDDYRVSR